MGIDADQTKLEGSQPIVSESTNIEARTADNDFSLPQAIESKKPAALSVLCVLAVGYSLYFAADILLPIALGIYLNLLLKPAVRILQRKGIPPAISALVVVALLVWSVAAAVSVASQPAQQWITEAPKKLHDIRAKFSDVNKPLAGIKKLSSEVKDIAAVDQNKGERIQKVAIEQPGLISQFMDKLPTSVTSIGIVIFLTFFLLASNSSFSRKCTSMSNNFAERRRVVMLFNNIQQGVSSYLVTITCINVALGLVVTGAMYILGFEDPWLWGIVAGLLNFIPYVGPLLTILILAFVGVTTFPDLIKALIAPLLYLALTIVEGQIITPLIVGHRLELNTVAVFLFLVFWGWIWGPAGMVLAIPILVSTKIVLENIPGMASLAPLLSK